MVTDLRRPKKLSLSGVAETTPTELTCVERAFLLTQTILFRPELHHCWEMLSSDTCIAKQALESLQTLLLQPGPSGLNNHSDF